MVMSTSKKEIISQSEVLANYHTISTLAKSIRAPCKPR